MKTIISSTLILLSFNLTAQELDEEFLNSLPEEIRADVLDKIDLNEDIDKPIYRNASTKLDKKDLDKQSVFGSKFFDTIQSSFMPINEPNLDASYILDFGDVLEVQLVGQKDSIEKYSIRRDGSINIIDIGKIYLSGLTLNDAVALIKAKVASTFIGTEAFISLANIRDIGVLITGNAYNPGIYTLNGNSNLLHALSMAGGINEVGSYREINHIRNNEVIDTLDVYEVLVYGKIDFSKKLRSGDSILVKPQKKIVSVESGVQRPGIYELKDGEGINQLLEFANGLNLKADTSNVIIKRAESGLSNVIDIDFDNRDSYKIYKGDSLFIREYKYNSVIIKGAVKNPGTYLLPLGTTLSELINTAGGYENSAYPFGGILNNKNSLEINEDAKVKLYDKFLSNLISNARISSAGQNDDGLALILKQLRETPSNGRVIAEFDLDVINVDPLKDTILENEDEILIPNKTQQVYIQGEVSNSGAIRYSPGKDIDYYLKNSGGALESADLDTIFIIHPNGQTQTTEINSRLSFLASNEKELLVYPGSIIYVPRSSDLTNNLEIASIWAPIISSVALSLTSLSVLNNSN
tara:strand:- start:2474 stop:4213 length:1740 start_codon:yes stop_codon:yes gene_type:complete